jgi:hypothetical protein
MTPSRRAQGGPLSRNVVFLAVIPAKAEIHFDFRAAKSITRRNWIPAFAGMTA